MKIAIEAQRLFRKKKHGMDVVALQLILALQEVDFTNEYFILVKPDEDNKVLNETKNFHIIEIPRAPYPIWEQFYLPKAVRKIKPDILHCTSNTAPLFCNANMVITLHDILYMKGIDFTRGSWYQRFGNLYRRIIVPGILKHCKRIITVSDFEKNEIDDYFHFSSGKVNAIYNAHNPAFKYIADANESKVFKKKYDLPDQFILYLGNKHPNKNIRNTLKALQYLYRNGHTGLKLVMPDIAPSFLNQILSEIDAPELYPSIHLTGYVPNQDLVYLYNLATLFIYPSFYESFGIPILESMASGTPVITSNCTAMPEVAGGAAALADPQKPEDIARTIQKLLTDETLYEKYKEEGLRRAASFKWTNAAMEVLSVYQQVFLQEKPSLKPSLEVL